MEKLNKSEIARITNLAASEFDNDLKKAIAADIYGEWVVKDCLGVPAFANVDKIAEIESLILNQQQLTENETETEVSIATTTEGADEQNEIPEEKRVDHTSETAIEEEIEPENKTSFTDAELLAIVLQANKENRTIGEVITEKMYGKNPLVEEINKYKVAYVKGLITQLLGAEAVEAEAEAVKTEETQPEVDSSEKTAVTEASTESVVEEVKEVAMETESETKTESASDEEVKDEKPTEPIVES